MPLKLMNKKSFLNKNAKEQSDRDGRPSVSSLSPKILHSHFHGGCDMFNYQIEVPGNLAFNAS